MKFIQKFLPKSNAPTISLAKKRIILGGVFVAILLLVIVFKLFLGQNARVEQALLSGQRLEVSLDSGEIQGKIITSKKQEDAKADPAAAPVDTVPVVDAASPVIVNENAPQPEVIPDADKVKVSAELAWINEDYIGPKLPKEITDGLLNGGSEATAATLELKKISVKELGDKPIIVVIIKGLGLSASTTEDTLDLPKDVTLGFSPYSPSIADWVERAKKKGHEFVINIPMETNDYSLNDPGPYALITKQDKEENITRLKMLLSLTKDYQAVYSEKEEIFTHAINSVKPVLESLKQQGKYFIYGGGYADFSLIQVADNMAYPIVVNDVLLDEEITADGINKKLAELEGVAKTRGYAVVMAHPYPITIRMLQRWLPEAEKRGFKLAPVSVLLGKDFIDK
jgi:polysaccharide deacetylase 2 family uncharacterized protein YibQ